MKNLVDLYEDHAGKLSDKWSLYLAAYDRLFSTYRSKSISMLEIGVQNGGSLEIWAKYFPNAKTIIGCDINPDCQKLIYADTRIKIVVGDAGQAETRELITAHSPSFDIVIEDGSHRSGDIIKAFASYFPLLNEGGVFVAEDLHCSYWSVYEGGLYYPYSSIQFFKALSDVINHEHWGINKNRQDLIRGFLSEYQCSISEGVLTQIHSVEFLNSVCVVKKKFHTENVLGKRFMAGKTADVVSDILARQGADISCLDQSANNWSTLEKSPAEDYQRICQSIVERDELIVRREQEITGLHNVIAVFENSRSWRYTLVFRKLAQCLRAMHR